MLDPSLPPEGKSLTDYIKEKYGVVIKKNDPNSALNRAGRNVGIEFNYTRRMVNTTKCHKLVEYSKQHGIHNDLMEIVLKEYFENAVDVSSVENLMTLANNFEALADDDTLEDYLNSDTDDDKIITMDYKIKRTGIHGVPHFSFKVQEKEYLQTSISGGQPPSSFKNVFNLLLENASIDYQ
eukprot:TRINITY_DN6160_c0_g1_i1.p1 TRINITY_DN6160_c0_g1~~TRINITY_DN6160_c0_g1_i1.p1  ORF type:complete len:181 (-),score=54.25 TRINITY_DN6160_c0_g1_i1:411-953(-)